MNFYEAFQEGLQCLKNNGVGYALQKLRLYRVRASQKPGETRQPFICVASESDCAYRVYLEGLGTSQERIIDYNAWLPDGIDLIMDDWNYAVSEKRVFWDETEERLKLISDECIVREKVALKATTTAVKDLPDLLRTAAQVLEAHLRTGADEIETVNPKD